ncbi:hypothetical protein HNQ52_002926 [Chiayiivirga flava]|uniref:Uncharacterized protein n=1 Tax=Chiayiivirga flava TaxID=659595 RepID=A0A7W8D9P7_9GAMM|nr:hypothetical protein [Chiayiivirga flava]
MHHTIALPPDDDPVCRASKHANPPHRRCLVRTPDAFSRLKKDSAGGAKTRCPERHWLPDRYFRLLLAKSQFTSGQKFSRYFGRALR